MKRFGYSASAASMALGMVFASPAFAQATPAAEDGADSDVIVVTGSLISNPNLKSTLPINVTTAADIELKQTTRAEAMLREIPGIVPNIGSAVNNGANGSSQVDLRGLGSNRNIVLLNGKRIVPAGLTGVVNLDNIPLALVGGLFLTWRVLDNISIATLVGFIAVGGIAARNGIMMLSHYLHLMKHEGEAFTPQMIVRGTKERMVPVLMTALAAGIGLLPLVFAGDQPGKEILHPVAVVIVGGLITSTLLDFAVTPAVFWLFGRKAAQRALENGAAAAQ